MEVVESLFFKNVLTIIASTARRNREAIFATGRYNGIDWGRFL